MTYLHYTATGTLSSPQVAKSAETHIHPRSKFQLPLPEVFTDHNAPPSVRVLFTEWVKQADASDNGIITINLRRPPYSPQTRLKAIRWLIAHKLLKRVEKGGGRGNGSRYFVRWSFKYKSPRNRMRYLNSVEHAKTVNPSTYRRKNKKVYSPRGTSRPRKSPHPSRKALAWAMVQVRKTLDQNFPTNRTRKREILAGVGASIWRAMLRGDLSPGKALARFVTELCHRLLAAHSRSGARPWYAFGGWIVRTILTELETERRERAENEAHVAEIARARQEVPRGEEFDRVLRDELGVSHLRDLIREQLTAGGSVLSYDTT